MSYSPRKFLYQETVYFRWLTTKIEWTEKGLSIIEGEKLPYSDEFEGIIINPSDETWEQFEKSVRLLNLNPVNSEYEITDGVVVDCNISFKMKLVQFNLENPDFKNYEKLRDLINELTICDDFPQGALFYGEDDEE